MFLNLKAGMQIPLTLLVRVINIIPCIYWVSLSFGLLLCRDGSGR